MQPRATPCLMALLLAGCSTLPERGPEPAPSPAPPSIEVIQAAQLARYATDLQSLVQGNRTVQAELMNDARMAYDGAKAGPAALRYGLMLAAPEHPQRDARQAQHVLQEALARSELLTTSERALGAVELARVEAELRLVTEKERLVAELLQESERLRTASANTALNRRLQTEIEESARLRKALDEARAKLDAITQMERNLPDRPPAPEGRNP